MQRRAISLRFDSEAKKMSDEHVRAIARLAAKLGS
jgi:hypothetical protein